MAVERWIVSGERWPCWGGRPSRFHFNFVAFISYIGVYKGFYKFVLGTFPGCASSPSRPARSSSSATSTARIDSCWHLRAPTHIFVHLQPRFDHHDVCHLEHLSMPKHVKMNEIWKHRLSLQPAERAILLITSKLNKIHAKCNARQTSH